MYACECVGGWVCECVVCCAVTMELVRLTTENGFLIQSKEEMKGSVDKLTQKVASMVS